MKVHTDLGGGFPEVIYQRSLAVELKEQNISFVREVSKPLFYKNVEVGKRRADFIIDNKVLVELKAVSELEGTHINQILNYLTAYKIEIGLLINFGGDSLTFKRFIN
jgi:GxxExxY protein